MNKIGHKIQNLQRIIIYNKNIPLINQLNLEINKYFGDINDSKSYFQQSLRTYDKGQFKRQRPSFNKKNNYDNLNQNSINQSENINDQEENKSMEYYSKKLNKNLPQLKKSQNQEKEKFQYEPEVKAFSQGLPQDWSHRDIFKYFTKQPDFQHGDIKEIYVVKNKLGLSTGKATFVFKDQKTKENFIEKYNGEFVQTDQYLQRFVLKNFEVKKKREYSNKQLAKIDTVYLYNMAYTITNQQIYEMAEDFGEVIYIDIPMKTEHLNKGYGFIKFGSWEQAHNFQEQYNDKTIDHRQIKIQIKNFEFDRHKKKDFNSKFDKILDIDSFKDTVKNENMILYNLINQGQIIDSDASKNK